MSKPRPRTTALVLRVCSAQMTSHGDFVWPTNGVVKAPDWDKKPECGHGLHGWLYGAGDHGCALIHADSRWLVVKVKLADVVMLGGKCKFPEGRVQHVGDRLSATEYLIAHEPNAANAAVIGASLKVGDNAFGQVGALGSLTGGYSSTLTGGDGSTLTGGDGSTLTGGKYSTLTGGEYSMLTFKWWDKKKLRHRSVVAYPGEDGVKIDTRYRLNGAHQLEEVK